MYLVQTVQTSWRPQLPLPKNHRLSPVNHSTPSVPITPTTSNRSLDRSMDTTLHQLHKANADKPANGQRKWSLGGLFRRKKKSGHAADAAPSDSSSDEAHRAGFPAHPSPVKSSRARRAGHQLLKAFDHIVAQPGAPVDRLRDKHPYPEPNGSLDRQLRRERIRAARVYSREPTAAAAGDARNNSDADADGDAASHNSLSSMSHFRSDESLANSAASSGSHRRSRSARTERYLKRMSKCSTDTSAGGGGRWQTQPVQYQHQLSNPSAYNAHHHALRSSASMSHVPCQPMGAAAPVWSGPPPDQPAMRPKYPAPVAADNRSISYETHLHRLLQRNGPPLPPPRDPRRLTMQVANTTESGPPSIEPMRPISFAFEPTAANRPHNVQHHAAYRNSQQRPSGGAGGRCVSDDHLWQATGTAADPGPQFYTTFAQPQPAAVANVRETPPPVGHRRFITRQSPDANVSRSPVQQQQQQQPQQPQPQQPPRSAAVVCEPPSAFRYVTDSTPRSRRPIHLVTAPATATPSPTQQPRRRQSPLRTGPRGLDVVDAAAPVASPMRNAADFWKQLDQQQAAKPALKPRSVSHSRVHAPAGRYHTVAEAGGGVVTGRLLLKPSRSCIFQLSEPVSPSTVSRQPSVNRYEEHVAQNIIAMQQPPSSASPSHQQRPNATAPAKPFAHIATEPNGNTIEPSSTNPRKSTNLEDAISELEAIYKSLHLDNDSSLLDRAERLDIAAPQTAAPTYRYCDSSDSDSPAAGEPDIVRDDVVFRSRRRANSIPRTIDAQPMFGIPIGPIPPSPSTDYLHATDNPHRMPSIVRPSASVLHAAQPQQPVPDPVADDLAVRLLRKDVAMLAAMCAKAPADGAPQLGTPRGRPAVQPAQRSTVATNGDNSGPAKNRAVRSMSANIYNLIQRDAAKPSGGCLDDYSRLEARPPATERSTGGSLNDLTDVLSDVSDHPTTLRMLQRERKISEKSAAEAAAAPTSSKAVFNLPSTLQAASTPPRSQQPATSDVLSAIGREAQQSSCQMSRGLLGLRRELKDIHQERPTNASTTKWSAEIDCAAAEVQHCLDMLQDVIAAEPAQPPVPVATKRLNAASEAKMIADIDSVAATAKTCEQVLDAAMNSDSVAKPTAAPTSVANLLQKLEPESRKIGAIAERCMRQLSQLGDMRVEIVGKKALPVPDGSGDYDNVISGRPKCEKIAAEPPSTPTSSKLSVQQELSGRPKCEKIAVEPPATPPSAKLTVQQELDKIMAECAEEDAKLVVAAQPVITVNHNDGGNDGGNDDDDDDDEDNDNEEMNIVILPPDARTPTQPYIENTIACTSSSTAAFDDNLPLPPIAESSKSSSSVTTDGRQSTSATPNRPHSSSITSFNAQSTSTSGDYRKSLSSGSAAAAAADSGDDIKTNSSANESAAHSNRLSLSPPPSTTMAARRTPSGDERSLYNSSEELAMIFGIRPEASATADTSAGKQSAEPLQSESPHSSQSASPAVACAATLLTPLPAQPTASTAQQSTVSDTVTDADIRSAFVSLATILEAHEDFHAAIESAYADDPVSPSASYTSNASIDMRAVVDVRPSMADVTSYSSMESIESTPDSGNHSLNDYPMTTTAVAVDRTVPQATVFASNLFVPPANSHIEEVCIEIADRSSSVDVVDAAVVAHAEFETIASIEERFNDIYDELIEINDEFFRCSTSSLSLATIDEDDERDFERLVRQECGDLQFGGDEVASAAATAATATPRSPPLESQIALNPAPAAQPPAFSNVNAADVHLLEPSHLLLACSVALVNSDLLTLLAIVVAIVTILALIIF